MLHTRVFRTGDTFTALVEDEAGAVRFVQVLVGPAGAEPLHLGGLWRFGFDAPSLLVVSPDEAARLASLVERPLPSPAF